MLRFYNILQYLAIKRKLILFLSLAIFINGILWSALVPIWHTPDEQAHFGQIVFVAEKGRNPNGEEKDLTEEIYLSEQLLGTARDKFGNNRFTFHPEYRIEHTFSYIGQYEASISGLTKTAAKTNFIHQEASRYPLLYYLPATIFYKLFYSSDLFTRVFIIRFWSLALFLGTAVATFLLGKHIFPKDHLSSLTLSLLVGFQPMMVFSNVGVNSDALGNFLFTLFLYLSAKILISGLHKKYFIFLIIVTMLSIYSKPQFIITLPLILLLLLLILLRDFSKIGKAKILTYFVFITLLLVTSLSVFQASAMTVITRFLTRIDIPSLVKYTREYTISHTISEVLPWYWGVYDWLGVTYPRIVHRIINRLIFVAGIGILLWIVRIIKNREWRKKEIQAVLFLNIAALLYFIAISFYDWLLWYTSKYPLGVQGRYFFPVISVHMLMLIIGWQQFFPKSTRLHQWVIKSFGLFMIFLNFFAIYTVLKTYYDIVSISVLIRQISQYKPWFFKGIYFVTLWMVYFITVIAFLIKYISYSHEKNK